MASPVSAPPRPFAGIPAALPAPHFAALRALLFALALLPLARLVLLGASGGLGANPVEFVTRSLGTWALVLLTVALAVTPLRRLTRWAWLARLRRMAGLFCFFYATLHVLAYALLDQHLDWPAIWADIVKRPFITAGFAAFALLVPLAATSTNAAVRRLGGRGWQRLHRLVYLAAPVAVVHYWWHKAGKNDLAEPAVYAAIVGALLALRLLHRLRGLRAARQAGTAPPQRR